MNETQVPIYERVFDVNHQAAQYGMELNSNPAHVGKIFGKLQANEIKYGAPYCPCLNNHTEDTICPCKYMREHQACRCGLYVREGAK